MAAFGFCESTGLRGKWHLPGPVESITIQVGDEMVDLWVPPAVEGVSHYEVPDVRAFLVGPDWTCEGIETWDDPDPAQVLYQLSSECGLLWGDYSHCSTPIQKEIRALNDLRKETDNKIQKGIADQEWFGVDGDKECRLNLQIYEDALDQWREEAEIQSCLGQARFVDYDQGTGETFYVRNSDGKVSTLTAEQLDQRVQLNIRFNLGFGEISWENNNHQYFENIANKYDSRQGVGGVIEGKQVGLEIVSTGENFSVAKWDCGGVFIPKGASDYLRDLTEEGWNSPGKKFLGNIAWSNSKYPWRLEINGVVGRISDEEGFVRRRTYYKHNFERMDRVEEINRDLRHMTWVMAQYIELVEGVNSGTQGSWANSGVECMMDVVEMIREDDRLARLIGSVSCTLHPKGSPGAIAHKIIGRAVSDCVGDILTRVEEQFSSLREKEIVEDYFVEKKRAEMKEFGIEGTLFGNRCEICRDSEEKIEDRKSVEEGLDVRYIEKWNDQTFSQSGKLCCLSCFLVNDGISYSFCPEVCSVCHMCDQVLDEDGVDQNGSFVFLGPQGIIDEERRVHEEICYCPHCLEESEDNTFTPCWGRDTLEAWKRGDFSVYAESEYEVEDSWEENGEGNVSEEKKEEIKKKLQCVGDSLFDVKEKLTDGEYKQLVEGMYAIMKDINSL